MSENVYYVKDVWETVEEKDWIKVEDGLPPLVPGLSKVSIDVRILFDDGIESAGYYVYDKEDPHWNNDFSFRIMERVIAWRKLSE